MALLSLLRLPFAAGLLLALLGKTTAAPAQPTPPTNRWRVKPGTAVYLDGLPSTPATISGLPDAAIASVEGMVVNDTTGSRKIPEYQYDYLVLTTKVNATSPATLALADKLHLSSAYISRPAPISIIAPPALAYITSHYPTYWLGGQVLEKTRKSTGAVTYQVQLAGNWGWRYVSFTEAGEFVSTGP